MCLGPELWEKLVKSLIGLIEYAPCSHMKPHWMELSAGTGVIILTQDQHVFISRLNKKFTFYSEATDRIAMHSPQ